MDHDVVRESQCSAGDGVIGSAYCGVAVIQNVLLSGRAFNKLFVFGGFAGGGWMDGRRMSNHLRDYSSPPTLGLDPEERSYLNLLA